MYLFLFGLLACQQVDQCLEATGSFVEEQRSLPFFHRVEVYDGIHLSLENKEGSAIKVQATEPDQVSLEVREDSTLVIRQLNRCRWKNTAAPVISLPAKQLSLVRNHSFGTIKSLDTLQLETFFIENIDVNGIIALQLEARFVSIYSNAGAEINLSGSSQTLQIFTQGWGKINAQHLQARQVQVLHNGQNDVAVSPIERLTAEIKNFGNLHVYHQPAHQEIQLVAGTGKVIFKQ